MFKPPEPFSGVPGRRGSALCALLYLGQIALASTILALTVSQLYHQTASAPGGFENGDVSQYYACLLNKGGSVPYYDQSDSLCVFLNVTSGVSTGLSVACLVLLAVLAHNASKKQLLVKLWWALQLAAAILWVTTAIIIVMRVSDANDVKTAQGEYVIPKKATRTTVAGLAVGQSLLWALGGLGLTLWAAMELAYWRKANQALGAGGTPMVQGAYGGSPYQVNVPYGGGRIPAQTLGAVPLR